MAPAISTHHAEWLSLVETSGPFLSVPVLSRALPQGLDAPDRTVTTRLREARTQLAEDQTLHRAWCEFVLRDVLEFEDAVVAGPEIPPGLEHRASEQGETVRPDLVVVDRSTGAPQPVLLVTIHPPTQQLDRRLADAAWSASPVDRIAALCRAAQVPLGLTTNGRSWTLVWARPGETTGVCTWDAELWLEEPVTLRAFRTLLGAHRFFTVAADETLPRLLEESAQNQQEVTDRLGAQVREAVELLIDALDRADHDRHGQLLGEIANEELYRAAVTMMMRLVFLFVAEERRLLPLDDPLYEQSYAASTLRGQLEERATRFGEDPLERSAAAWYRLLALSRAVHGGIEHEALRLPAYGGGLFDPDRYPFLEGRTHDSAWRQDTSRPLPVDDRTVLHLLTALQVLEEPGRAGQPRASVRLSFRALDVEQIGHVYEGLLDHTAVRTFDAAVGLVGAGQEEIAITELERARDHGEAELIELLVESTKKSANALTKALAAEPDPDRVARLLAVCDNDPSLRDRLLPYVGVIRNDLRDNPRVFLPGALYVTKALERRSSGTYYTPRSLAEEVVLHALDPIAYSPGPAEETDPAQWRLNTASELLDLKIADIAMGSGAFLVAACRYVAARLLEAWNALDSERAWTVFGRARDEAPSEPPIPADPAEREFLAHRLVAERCIYGVDKNPLAVEMAKLSLWLITLAKDRPFSFLDHALRTGDSLLGITHLKQIELLHINPRRGADLHGTFFNYTAACGEAIDEALRKRTELEAFPALDVRDSERKSRLHLDASAALETARLLGDLVIGAALATAQQGAEAVDDALTSIETKVGAFLDPRRADPAHAGARTELRDQADAWLNVGRSDLTSDRACFHWPLELPEVFTGGRDGFDAVIGNPPFQGGRKISGAAGKDYREYLVRYVAEGRKGSADLVAYFFLRGATLSSRLGLLATDSIGQGETREVALDSLCRDWTITRAVKGVTWPGGASLEIAKVWMQRQAWLTPAILDDAPVKKISAALDSVSRVSGPPRRLAIDGFAFQGSNLACSGFVLDPRDGERLIGADSRNTDVVRPYLGARDLNEHPTHEPSRYIIDFRDWPIERAQNYAECFEWLTERVYPEVKAKQDSYSGWMDRWWQFWNPRAESYRAIDSLERVIAIARVSNTVQPAFLANDAVFDVQIVVFAYDDDAHFGLLSSAFHWWWVVTHGSKRGVGGAPRYTATACFETFPQPIHAGAIGTAATAMHAHRAAVMLKRQEGLTKTYNRVHNDVERAEDITVLRQLHVSLDYAVCDAYGWTDIDLGHGFHETRQGIRYTFEPVARQEVLDRLLELNLERSKAEAASGAVSKKRPSARKRAADVSAGQTTMFGHG